MTDYLFAKPNFLEGVARALDLGATLVLFNDSPTEQMADRLAMQSDWVAVGEDIREAIRRFEAEHVGLSDHLP